MDVLASQFTYNGQQIATVSDISATTLTSAGGTYSLVNDSTRPTLAVKGLTARGGIIINEKQYKFILFKKIIRQIIQLVLQKIIWKRFDKCGT